MSSKSPIFPMLEPQHFSDYGFDPQIDYFQFMEEARKHKREASSRSMVDSFHFKLQKPISKDDSLRKTTRQISNSKSNVKRKRWWKTALLFFKWKRPRWAHHAAAGFHLRNGAVFEEEEEADVHRARARAFRASMSGPVYMTESSWSGSSTPYSYRSTSRPSSGPIAGTLAPAVKGDLEIPYLSLRELTREHHQRISASPAPSPIYLVT